MSSSPRFYDSSHVFPMVLPPAPSKFPTFSAHEIEGKKVGDQVIWHGAAEGCDKPWNILEPLGTWCQKRLFFFLNPNSPTGGVGFKDPFYGCLG